MTETEIALLTDLVKEQLRRSTEDYIGQPLTPQCADAMEIQLKEDLFKLRNKYNFDVDVITEISNGDAVDFDIILKNEPNDTSTHLTLDRNGREVFRDNPSKKIAEILYG